MINRKENIIQNLELVVFLLLVGIVFASFSGKSEKLIYDDAQYELVTGLHSNSIPAMLVDFVQIPFLHKAAITSVDKDNLLCYSNYLKIAADNRNTFQRIISIKHSMPYLRPLSSCRFYYHLFSSVTEEPLA